MKKEEQDRLKPGGAGLLVAKGIHHDISRVAASDARIPGNADKCRLFGVPSVRQEKRISVNRPPKTFLGNGI